MDKVKIEWIALEKGHVIRASLIERIKINLDDDTKTDVMFRADNKSCEVTVDAPISLIVDQLVPNPNSLRSK